MLRYGDADERRTVPSFRLILGKAMDLYKFRYRFWPLVEVFWKAGYAVGLTAVPLTLETELKATASGHYVFRAAFSVIMLLVLLSLRLCAMPHVVGMHNLLDIMGTSGVCLIALAGLVEEVGAYTYGSSPHWAVRVVMYIGAGLVGLAFLAGLLYLASEYVAQVRHKPAHRSPVKERLNRVAGEHRRAYFAPVADEEAPEGGEAPGMAAARRIEDRHSSRPRASSAVETIGVEVFLEGTGGARHATHPPPPPPPPAPPAHPPPPYPEHGDDDFDSDGDGAGSDRMKGPSPLLTPTRLTDSDMARWRSPKKRSGKGASSRGGTTPSEPASTAGPSTPLPPPAFSPDDLGPEPPSADAEAAISAAGGRPSGADRRGSLGRESFDLASRRGSSGAAGVELPLVQLFSPYKMNYPGAELLLSRRSRDRARSQSQAAGPGTEPSPSKKATVLFPTMSARAPASLPVSQPVSHHVSQPVSHPVSHSVSHSAPAPAVAAAAMSPEALGRQIEDLEAQVIARSREGKFSEAWEATVQLQALRAHRENRPNPAQKEEDWSKS